MPLAKGNLFARNLKILSETKFLQDFYLITNLEVMKEFEVANLRRMK
jgi:hypothetical protein